MKRFKAKLNVYLNQWKTQLSSNNFEIFIVNFCESLSKTLESIIFEKKFHQMGALLLDKV